MDTPTIAAYYREIDPMKRKALLEQSVQAGEEPQENAIRKELWEIRYQDSAQGQGNTRADGYFGLWMAMEYNRDAGKRLFGYKSARKEITKYLEKLKFKEMKEKDDLYQQLFYRECCHMIRAYMELCEKDKSYGSSLCGLIRISSDGIKEKVRNDIVKTAIDLPASIHMEEELGIITRAAREMYGLYFPDEERI